MKYIWNFFLYFYFEKTFLKHIYSKKKSFTVRNSKLMTNIINDWVNLSSHLSTNTQFMNGKHCPLIQIGIHYYIAYYIVPFDEATLFINSQMEETLSKPISLIPDPQTLMRISVRQSNRKLLNAPFTKFGSTTY